MFEFINRNKEISSGSIFALFSFLNKGMSFLLSAVLAKYLTTSEFGQLSLFVTVITITDITINLNTRSYFSIAYFQKEKKDLYKYISSIWDISFIVLVILLFIISLLPNMVFLKYIGFSQKVAIIGVLISFFQVISNLNLDYWRLKEKPIIYGFFTTIIVVANFIFTILLLTNTHLGWKSRAFSQIFVAFSVSAYSIIFFVRKRLLIISFFNWKIIKETLIYSLPLVPHSIAGWLSTSFNKYVINFNYTTTEVGLYSFATMLSGIVMVFGNSFNSSNSVFIFKNLSNGTFEKVGKNNRLMIWVFVGFSLLTYLFAFTFIKIIFKKYEPSIKFLLPLCVSALANCIYFLYCNFLFYYHKTKLLMNITLISSLVSASLALILVKYSLMIPAILEMMTNIVILFVVYFYSMKILKFNKVC